MGQAKIIVLFIVVLALIVFFWQYFPTLVPEVTEPGELMSAYQQIAEIWKSNGVEAEYYHSNFDALLLLPSDKLFAMKESFETKETQSEEASEKALLVTYADLTDLAIEIQRLSALEDQIDAIKGDICEQVFLLQAYLIQLEKTVTAFESFAHSSNAFAQEYRENAESIKFYELGSSYAAQLEALKTHYIEVQAAVRLCA